MITALSTTPLARRADAPPRPAVCPRPMPAPVDQLDMTVIDTPQKAAQSPLLDPVVQLALAGAVAAGAAGLPNVGLVINNTFGDSFAILAGSADAAGFVGLAGALDDAQVQGGMTANEQGASYAGTIGDNAETLEVTLDEASQSVRMTGAIGQVPVNLTLHAVERSDGAGVLVTSGTLGEETYATTTTVIPAEGFGALQGQLATIEVKGAVGALPIDKSHTVTFAGDQQEGSLSIEGSGVNAGLDATGSVTLMWTPHTLEPMQ